MAPRHMDAKLRTANAPKSPDPSLFRQNGRQGPETPSAAQLQRELESSMLRVKIHENNNTHNTLVLNNTARHGLRFEDDQTQISSSSTKPASSDSRSATSGVTYAMDERESLRPDDSASTRAAEDEDSNSGPASGAPSSRVGSEAGGRAFQDQFNELGRVGPGLHRLQSYRIGIPGIAEECPQQTMAPLVPALPAPINGGDGLAINKASSFAPEYNEPDEKLLEALQSSKDRLFLMSLEQQVITFVKHSTELTLDLPPCNSFCRLLAHKLADYYALTHYVDNAVTSVRLYRTPYCRIPPPLSDMVKAQSPTETTPTSQPSFQIMRREGMGKDGRATASGVNTTASSMAPSKAGSDTGDDSQHGTGFVSPTESVGMREKFTLTREEREAKYKETRERIFKGVVERDIEDTGVSTEGVNGVSRTSSGNGRKKSKKSKRNNDDFEVRSQFNAFYTTPHYATSSYEQAASPVAYFSPYTEQGAVVGGQSEGLSAAVFQQGLNQGYQSMSNVPPYHMGLQNTSVPVADLNGQFPGVPMYSDYNQQYQPQFQPQYQSQYQTQYYQQMMHHPQMMGQQSPSMSSPVMGSHTQLPQSSPQMSDQTWPQNGFAYPYQQPRQQQQGYFPQMQERSLSNGHSTASYTYAQVPYPPNIQQGNPQHPLPGSYNRPSFNPQTRAFIPGSGYQPSTTTQYNGMPSDSNGHSPGMSLPNGNSHSSQRPQATALHMASSSSQSRKTSSQSASSQPATSQSSSLAKWGTPANLPPKPPPVALVPPYVPDNQHSLPANIHAPVNIQPQMNGQPMPCYQNGVYSMPSPGSH